MWVGSFKIQSITTPTIIHAQNLSITSFFDVASPLSPGHHRWRRTLLGRLKNVSTFSISNQCKPIIILEFLTFFWMFTCALIRQPLTLVSMAIVQYLGPVHLKRWVWGRESGGIWVDMKVNYVLFFKGFRDNCEWFW